MTANANKRHSALRWNATVYVAHVADVLHIWSERVAAAAIDRSGVAVTYGEGRLGEVPRHTALSRLVS